MSAILLDTNILVYANDFNNPLKQERAHQIIRALYTEGQGYLSIQSLSEFSHVTIRKSRLALSVEQILEQVSWFARIFRLLELTPFVVLEAVRGVHIHGLPYFDAQIWACAKLNQIPVVFSEDFQDGQTLEGVRFINPFSENFDIKKWL